jgi:hypothetical protein
LTLPRRVTRAKTHSVFRRQRLLVLRGCPASFWTGMKAPARMSKGGVSQALSAGLVLPRGVGACPLAAGQVVAREDGCGQGAACPVVRGQVNHGC